MRVYRRLRALVALSVAAGIFTIGQGLMAESQKPRSEAEIEEATRLQVFLDRAEFAPGKIDGRYGEFTLKALALYRQSRGEPPGAPVDEKASKQPIPDVHGLDLASIGPVFIDYTVTDADLKSVGDLPESTAAQAKKKSLPYKDAAEAVAEKFHADIDFLAELNPGKTQSIKTGDVLRVPNVEPFELPAVKDLKPGSEMPAPAANEVDGGVDAGRTGDKESKAAEAADAAALTTDVKVDVKTNMLSVYESGKLIAAYPVTIGSERTESPVGDWKVRGVAKMPNFRWDEAMLQRGERSSNFYMLPPGPNNPVGVIWIQLNKKGIGLHGTNDPDQIGRSASHGCVRLANWDVVRLAAKVKAGVPVSIH